MKLIYELPERVRQMAEEWLQGEEILYCTPYDLSLQGELMKGWLAVTGTRILCLEEDRIARELWIRKGSDYKAVGMVGNGVLEAVIDGEPTTLVRYTMYHVPRYLYIARILNDLAQGRVPKVFSDDRESKCPKCGRILPEGTRVCTACINKTAVLKRLWSVIRPYRFLMLAAALLFTSTTLLQLLIPYINRTLIDSYIVPMKRDLTGILLCIAGIALSQFVIMLINIGRGRVMMKVGGKVSRDLRAMVYAKVQALSLNYLSQRKTGDLMNRITGDTSRIQNFIQQQSVMAINQVFMFAGICTLLFVNSWRLALLVILPIPLVVFYCAMVRRRLRSMYHKQAKVFDRANSMLQDILNGIRVVKAFGQEEREVGRFKGISRRVADITGSNEKVYNTIFPSLGFVIGIGQFLVLYYGGKLVIGQELKLGELVQFSSYASMLYGPLSWLTFIPRWFTEAMTSAERVFEIMDEEPDVKDYKNAKHMNIKGKVIFQNVTFGYQSHEPVLENISLEVEPGEMIGLVGHSGAGKSTLINLLMRFYDVDEGQIVVDETDIREIGHQDLRSQVGVVLQETFLFAGSILDNIRYSKPDATLEEVIRAARIANAHDFIMKFPDGYDTRVGEHGQKLSGGERQRIAIARAILMDPKILILDEATASLDTETEQKIQEALGYLVKNRTTFAIAHRLSTLRNADRILVLDKGKVAELDTHDKLLKDKGIYYKLVTAQRQMSRLRNG